MYPGYSDMVRYGHRFFLAIALGFALLVDAFLIVNFYWTEQITPSQRNLFLAALLVAWILLTLIAAFWKHRLDAAAKPEQADETFLQTISHYLRGDWFTAESLMLPYLEKYPKDIEVLLLQATMYRRTERYEEALLVLDRLQLLEGSRYWHSEIEAERKMIGEAADESVL